MEKDAQAPGLKWRARKDGRVPYWVARADAVKAGYPVRSSNLRQLAGDPAAIAARCQRLQGEMLLWMATRGRADAVLYDGTLGSLFDVYQTHPETPFRTLAPNSRHPYTVYVRRMKAMIGSRRVDAITGLDVMRWHKTWRAPDEPGGPEKLGAARMAVTVLKSVLSFGALVGIAECKGLRETLRLLRLPNPPPRRFAPTAEDIIAARKAAHAIGRPSLALAYALQFETTLRQNDVIGQWLPLNDPMPSAVLGPAGKWVGLTWSHIDAGGVLTIEPHKTQRKSGAVVSIDLTLCPMVQDELRLIPEDRRAGPVVIDEKTRLPFIDETFRTLWRRDIAPRAELPVAMWNRDIRAGGVTEGKRAGADHFDTSKMAGHTSPRTTARVYDRDVLEASRRVARKRVAARNENGGGT